MKFQCPKHKSKTVEHHTYSQLFRDNGTTAYRDKAKNVIRCPNKTCEMPMIPVDDDTSDADYSTINYGKFTSMSPEAKKDHLKKRSKEHNKKFKEHRRHLHTEHL